MPLMTCPTCGATFKAETSKSLPFCSPRCKQVDLGRWLSEKQALPYVSPPEDDEEPMGEEQTEE